MDLQKLLLVNRDERNKYLEASTPWPADKEKRVSLIQWRIRLDQANIALAKQHIDQPGVKSWIKDLERAIRSDLQMLASW